MKTLYYLVRMITLSWLLMLCYSSHAAAAVAGDGSDFGVQSSMKCIDHERKVLLRFKQGIVSDYCGLLSSWGDHEDCCLWYGIRCSNRTGHVIMLRLQGGAYDDRCLEGKLDPSLFDLKHLKYLDLSFNNFNQAIPLTIDSLTNLEHLNFSNSYFFGEIPPQLGNLSKLSSLDLSFNDDLNARSLQWVSRLTLLREIDLRSCNLGEATAWFQTINKLPSLSVLHLDDCNLPFEIIPSSLSYINSSSALRVVSLSGNNLNDTSILQWLFNLSNHLEYLDLSANLFSGPLPSEFGNMHSLSYLVLSYNSFSGPLPSEFGTMHSLSYLDLSDNSFSGPLPSEFGNMHSLSYLGLSDNSFSGPLPSEFGNMHSLSYLGLFHNSFSGPLPSEFGNMHSLSYLDLSYNSFSGPLPSEFGNMHSLSYLDLLHNSFSGPLPSEFGNMHSLSYLDLSYNSFSGPLPSDLNNLCSLQSLHLADNNFNDDMSTVLQALSTGCANKPLLLESLDLSMNHFWGSIPDIITSFSSLRELRLGNNNLNGTITHNHFSNLSRLSVLDLSNTSALAFDISDDWIPPFQLEILDLGSSNLGPSFPNWLSTQTKIQNLDISNTQISDTIPAEFWTNSISNVYYLNMSRNKIHGVLPNLSTTFHSGSVIDLSSNKFEGSIPSFFVGNKYLSSLYLNDNKFSDATHVLCPKTEIILQYLNLSSNLLFGKLPDCWTKFDGLSSLHLENNNFSGSIPPSIGALRYLRFLHLENNNFSGELPASLLNCTFLEILVIENNSLTGNIPSTIGIAFTNLGILNLRGNKFFGSLPLTLCQMSNLKILDLANNRFSKTIPNCIYNLRAMMTQSKPLSYGGKFEVNDDGSVISLTEVNEETVDVMWKREEQIFKEYSMALVNLIDLSHNELEGTIPEGISNLTELISLDLSRNKLSGVIPSNIGQLTSLESLDLSNNHLSGEIPTSLAQINFLAALNVSNNDLSGKIPHGTQLQGFDSSAFEGNILLCGAPLRDCPGDEAPPTTINNGDKQDKHGYDEYYLGLCISVVLGFIIGFWGVCGTLVVKRSWRHAFFRFYDDMKDKIYIMVVVHVARAWRKP